jgi:putative transposase
MGSAARCCRALGLARSSFYRKSQGNTERMLMKQRIIQLSQAHPRYGYRRIGALLRRQGQRVNTKRVQRIRRQEALQVRKKQRATRRVGISSAARQRARRANHVWSWDIIHDQTQSGSSLRMLTLIDEHTKQSLAIEVGRSIRAVDAIRVLEGAIERYGVPEYIRSDNGPEFIAQAIGQWMSINQIKTLYIKPGFTLGTSLRRKFSRQVSRRVLESRTLRNPCRSSRGD